MNPKKFKVLPLDLGLHQRLLGLELSTLLTDPLMNFINKGSLAEIFVGLELCAAVTASHSAGQIFYWHCEARSSNAEVDYIIQKSADIIPIEVKSGKQGSMQSMALFLAEHRLAYGIRLSLENCSSYDKIRVLPLYLARAIRDQEELPWKINTQ